VMPMSAILTQSSPGGKRAIVLRSVGPGPAFNLAIDRIQFGNARLSAAHDGNVMAADETAELRFISHSSAGRLGRAHPGNSEGRRGNN
jgi:hypothetical protein